MFNSGKIDELEKELRDLRKRVFVLENPPEMELGQEAEITYQNRTGCDRRIKNGIVTKINIIEDMGTYRRVYEIFDKDKSETINIVDWLIVDYE